MLESRKCDYGCGQDAIKQFKNSMYCCSEYTNQCPLIRKKNSNNRQGINPWKNREHPMKGRKNPHQGIKKYNWREIQEYYDNGHSIRDCYKKFGFSRGAERKAYLRGDLKTRNKSEAAKLAVLKGRVVVATKGGWTENMKKRLSDIAKKRKLGGKRNSYRFKYKGIILESSYELRLAKLLDKHKIQWMRPECLMWCDKNGENHRYYPDFYLPEYDVYLDPKNKYLIEKDKEKINHVIEQNGVDVKLISLEQICFWEQNGLMGLRGKTQWLKTKPSIM